MIIERLREHEKFKVEGDNEKKELFLKNIKNVKKECSINKLRAMGMDYDIHSEEFSMSYYIGADWIDEDKNRAIVVTPKINNIDFQTMFMKCFTCVDVNSDLDKLFFIRTEDKPIEIDSEDFQIEPLLIICFMNIVKQIVLKGLKSDYIYKEEQLKSKIKGKILIGKYCKHGYAVNRKDIVDCRYQEYSIDCIDNRILKKALLLCNDMLIRSTKALGIHAVVLQNIYREIIPAFEHVSDKVSVKELHRTHINPMFKEYRNAMPLAKMIIKKEGYCVGHDNKPSKQQFPPFVIDMPILFERYVYSLLAERYGTHSIGYQISASDSKVDFCKYDEFLIIDTKYKTEWQEKTNSDDVRQLSGYARNMDIRRKIGLDEDDNTICPCLIIYPDQENGNTDLKNFNDHLFTDNKLNVISKYKKFKKLSVKLPRVSCV